jgi:energy-coupling factor transporter ATP-binding protein EcfA2
MQILSLQADNFKRLRAVQITPKGDLVLVAGRNAQGKSSVLDAISAALAGAGACPADPIRHGEASASIRLDLGEVVVTRKFTPGGSTLTLTNAEGAKFGSPQKMLDAMLGQIAFDPLEFTRMKPREQFDQLKDVARVDLDLEKLEQLNKADFDRRTDLNRDAKAARAQLEGLRLPAGDVGEPRDVADLIRQIQDTQAMRSDAVQEREDRQRLQAQVDRKRAQIEQLRQQAIALQAEVKAHLVQLEPTPATKEPAEFDQAIADLNERIRTAQTHNETIQQGRQALAKKTELETLAVTKETAAQGLTEAMAARQTAKEQALAAAKFPVKGLSLGDGQVLFNGVPLAQASSAEQLRISTALAMAANPKVKVVLIREGSLLDQDGLRLVAEMATSKGYQVWCEKVDSSRGIGVVIEDGQVIADNQEEEGMEVPA